jgi:HPt (histidine-containing phosphotransfer) domain-containing protein
MDSELLRIPIQSISLEEPLEGLEEMSQQFLEDRKKEFKTIKDFLDNSQLDDIKKICHNWKGFCKPYGFNGLGQLAEELEGAIKNSNLEEINVLVLEMEHYLTIKQVLIRAH